MSVNHLLDDAEPGNVGKGCKRMLLSESIAKSIRRPSAAPRRTCRRVRAADLGEVMKEKKTCFTHAQDAGIKGDTGLPPPPLFVFKAMLSGSMSVRETENPSVDVRGRNKKKHNSARLISVGERRHRSL